MITYFKIPYKLCFQSGKNFFEKKEHEVQVAQIIANTETEAIEYLQNDFPGWKIEVAGDIQKFEMTEEEYENG